MGRSTIVPTGVERTFDEDEIIVSKTDLKGRLTYVNDVFLRVSGYRESELLGSPHSVIRHPDMPRAIFRLLWERIQSGREIFAYVVNLSKDGSHYWVIAHVTPTFDAAGTIVGYHSNRRVPDRSALAAIQPLYRKLLAEEQRHADRRDGLERSWRLFQEELAARGQTYDELVWSLLDVGAAGGVR